MIALRRGLAALAAIRGVLSHLCRSMRITIGTKVAAEGRLLRIRLGEGRMTDGQVGLRGTLSLDGVMLTRCVNRANSNFRVRASVPIRSVPIFPRRLHESRRTSLILAPRCRLLRGGIRTGQLRGGLTVKGGLPAVTVNTKCVCSSLVSGSRPFNVTFTAISVPVSG